MRKKDSAMPKKGKMMDDKKDMRHTTKKKEFKGRKVTMKGYGC